MKRVAIIGSPGAGKSTFARRLGQTTGLPVHHLDSLFWKPGWVESDRSEFQMKQDEIIAQDAWIIDGNYSGTMDRRVAHADTIIWLDFPRHVCLWRAVKRAIQHRGQTRPDMAKGCPERMDLAFLRYIWGFRRRNQSKLSKRMEVARTEGKQSILLSTRRAVEQYLRQLEEVQ